MHLPSLDSVNYTLAILGIVALFIGWWRGWWESPRRRETRARDKAVAEAILGEPEVRDLAGKVIAPSKPGLVSRTSTLEQAVSTLVDQDARIKLLETDVEMLKRRELKDLALIIERAKTAETAGEALKLIRERDTLDGTADEPSGEL